MWQNRPCQIYWQILHPERNVMRSTVLQVRGCKSPLVLGSKTLGLQRGRGQGNVQQLWTRCGHRAQVSCPHHLYSIRIAFKFFGVDTTRFIESSFVSLAHGPR